MGDYNRRLLEGLLTGDARRLAYSLDDDYLEVHGTYNLLSNCSYNPIISRVTVVMGLIFGL